jgi:hypothetical protein
MISCALHVRILSSGGNCTGTLLRIYFFNTERLDGLPGQTFKGITWSEHLNNLILLEFRSRVNNT